MLAGGIRSMPVSRVGQGKKIGFRPRFHRTGSPESICEQAEVESRVGVRLRLGFRFDKSLGVKVTLGGWVLA